MDNEVLRSNADFIQSCYKTTTTLLNPIVEWTDEDVWEFLHYYGCDSNPMYKCGLKRIGCIGCPLARKENRIRELKQYPKYAQNYMRAFERMLKERELRGKVTDAWHSAEEVMRWWLGGKMELYDEGLEIKT